MPTISKLKFSIYFFSIATENRETLKEETKAYENIKHKLNVQNVVSLYKVAEIFNLEELSNVALTFIEEHFLMVVKTKSFRALDYVIVAKILASLSTSETSDLKVFQAVDRWMSYKTEKRRKFSKNLLIKARIHALPDAELNRLLREPSLFYKTNKGISVFKDVLYDPLWFPYKKPTLKNSRLFSYNPEPNVLILGGYNIKTRLAVSNVYHLDGRNLNNVKALPSLLTSRVEFEAVCIKGEIYVFGGYSESSEDRFTVEKYSPATNKWKRVARRLDGRYNYCSCSYDGKIFTFGGNVELADDQFKVVGYCIQFDPEKNKWKKLASMKVKRSKPACSVLNGRIVVSGGEDYFYENLKSVESYDASADEWTRLPDMVHARSAHRSLVVRNKLYVVSGEDGTSEIEVFDGGAFATIKSPISLSASIHEGAVLIGDVIHVFLYKQSCVVCYDVVRDEWFEKFCHITGKLEEFAFVEVPWYLE